MEKFQENNSRYLVNGRLEAALFLKVTGVQDARDGNKKQPVHNPYKQKFQRRSNFGIISQALQLAKIVYN